MAVIGGLVVAGVLIAILVGAAWVSKQADEHMERMSPRWEQVPFDGFVSLAREQDEAEPWSITLDGSRLPTGPFVTVDRATGEISRWERKRAMFDWTDDDDLGPRAA